MSDMLSDQVKRRIDDAKDAVAVVDKTLAVVYANKLWPVRIVQLSLTHGYLVDEYEAATLLQGIQEVIEGRRPLYTRKCRVHHQPELEGFRALQITVTECLFRDGSRGAEMWCEHARTGTTEFGALS